ncbi:MAG: PD-(D/E)XK nuclease family protein [Candidatus Eiseniibacteriota bacterium]|jgi:RecB family exonuclease
MAADPPVLDLTLETTDDPAGLRAWLIDHLAALPDRLERRATVLTASDALAHQLRRHGVVERHAPGWLLGVSMARPAGLAFELLARAGQPARRGGEARRRLELRRRFAAGVEPAHLGYFTASDLVRRGYVEAMARAIDDLERAGLDVASAAAVATALPDAACDRARLEDVVTLWRLAEGEPPGAAADGHPAPPLPCLTAAGAMRRAASLLRGAPGIATPLGPVFALLTSDPDVVLLEFLAALPRCRVALLAGRPERGPATQRWRQLVSVVVCGGADDRRAGGADARRVAARDAAVFPAELARLRRRLFQTGGSADGTAAAGACAAVPRPAPDGDGEPHATGQVVDLEEYASLEEEVEATVHWIVEQVLDGVALEEIAVVATRIDVYAPPVIDRLARLPIALDAVQVLDDRPASHTVAGRRLRALLEALASHLSVERMVPLLGTLRPAPAAGAAGDATDAGERWTPSRLARLVDQAGIAGGSAAHPDGARSWLAGLERFRQQLAADRDTPRAASTARRGAIGEEAAEEDVEPEKRAHLIARRERARWTRTLDAILPAVRELDAIVTDIADALPLDQLWSRIAAFVRRWLPLPPSPPRLLERFERELAPVLAPDVAAHLAGGEAVEFLVERFAVLRTGSDGGGRAALTLGSPRAVRGLCFRAVRVIGLAEGVLPPAPREDPVLPAAARARIEAARPGRLVVERALDQVLSDLHDLCRLVMGTGERLAFSAPRRWVDGSQRELSGAMLEVAMALGRQLDGGEAPGPVPDAEHLQRLYIAPGVGRRRRTADALPLLPAVELRSARRSSGGAPSGAVQHRVPPRWLAGTSAALDLRRLCHLDDARLLASCFEPLDGDLRAVWSPALAPALAPGLAPSRAVSPTGLGRLLACPHAFMLSSILGLEAPPEPPRGDRLDPLTFGSLTHRVLERLMERAGTALCRHEGRLGDWLGEAARLADAAFDAALGCHPLTGAGVIARERARLAETVARFVRYEWNQGRRTFVASERDFGDPAGVPLGIGEGAQLHVHGTIDRLDRLDDGSLAVRDFKTGRAHSLAEEPIQPSIDLQIALYARVVAAGPPAARVAEAAYVYAAVGRDPDRRFTGRTLEVLDRALTDWLRVAHAMLASGVFPRTPDPGTCRYCDFRALCDADPVSLRAAKLRRDTLPPAAIAFRQLLVDGASTPGEDGER